MDGIWHEAPAEWDILIAHPPCTFLTVSGNRHFSEDKYGAKALGRYMDRVDAIRFFMEFVYANAKRIAIENPIGIMSGVYRKPDQIIQPWQYGNPEAKSTCLWLKNLPKLTPTEILEKPEGGWLNQSLTPDGRSKGFVNYDSRGKIMAWNDPETAKLRSKTYPGIAKAMADQWGTEETTNANENSSRCEKCQHWVNWDWRCRKTDKPTGPADTCGDWVQMDPGRDLMQTFSP